MAFPMKEGEFTEITPNLLGDVVISLQTTAREGRMAGISMEERLLELMIHGILHLFGYDHEKSEREAQCMEQKTQALLKHLDHLEC